MSNIGYNIKKLRNVKGLSQQAFAELFNLTRGNISSYEEMRAEPKIDIALKIANYFSIPLSNLIDKKLSVNEILNFNDYFEANTSIAPPKNLAGIPFLSRERVFLAKELHDNLESIPKIFFPLYGQENYLAVENSHFIPKHIEANNEENNILFFGMLQVDNLHTLTDKFGLYFSKEDFFIGKFQQNGTEISLVLNEWKSQPVSIDQLGDFWKLEGKYNQIP